MSLLIQFVADKSLSSQAIECFGGSYWSHSAIYISSGIVIDARSDIVQGIEPGVQKRPGSYLDAYPRWVKMELPADERQFKIVVAGLENELRKPYDKIGIWGFATCSLKDRNWRDRRAWFCDELDAYVLEVARVIPHIFLPVYRLTPGALSLICQAAGGRIIATKGLQDVYAPGPTKVAANPDKPTG